MAKFDPYSFCQKHGVGSKTPIKDTVSGITVTLPGLPDSIDPEDLAEYAKENGASVSFPKRQIDATHTTKQKGGKLEGPRAEEFMVGWLGVEADPPPAKAPVKDNGRQTSIPAAAPK